MEDWIGPDGKGYESIAWSVMLRTWVKMRENKSQHCSWPQRICNAKCFTDMLSCHKEQLMLMTWKIERQVIKDSFSWKYKSYIALLNKPKSEINFLPFSLKSLHWSCCQIQSADIKWKNSFEDLVSRHKMKKNFSTISFFIPLFCQIKLSYLKFLFPILATDLLSSTHSFHKYYWIQSIFRVFSVTVHGSWD